MTPSKEILAPRTTRLLPDRYEPVPSVDMLTVGPSIDPWQLRSEHFKALSPVSSHYHGAWRGDYDSIKPIIEAASPRLVTIHCFTIHTDALRLVALENPDIRFISVCHSSQAHLSTNPDWMLQQAAHLKLSRQLPNVWYSTPDERMQYGLACPGSKCLHWPNPVRKIDAEPEWPTEPVAAIIGRHDVIKNIPTQLIAIAIAGIHKVQIVSQTTDAQRESIMALCEAYGLEADICWFSWDDHIQNMARNVSVVMQASFSESFNYVALESMLTGTPVVGSPAIRYLPKKWQANPDDAESIAARIERILHSTAQASALALQTGQFVSRRQNRAYVSLINSFTQTSQPSPAASEP